MRLVPKAKQDALTWFDQRAEVWAARADELGVSGEITQRLVAIVNDAQAKRTEAQLAMHRAAQAVAAQDAALGAMRTLGGSIVNAVRAYALTQPDPHAVFNIANLPPVAGKSPRPPHTPTDVRARLNPHGVMEISWNSKAQAGGGVVYTVTRSLEIVDSTQPSGIGVTPATQIAVGGAKTIRDDTLLQGTISATYVVFAHKGTHASAASSPCVVRLSPRDALVA